MFLFAFLKLMFVVLRIKPGPLYTSRAILIRYILSPILSQHFLESKILSMPGAFFFPVYIYQQQFQGVKNIIREATFPKGSPQGWF